MSPHGKNFFSVDDHFERCFIWKKWTDSHLIQTYELGAGKILKNNDNNIQTHPGKKKALVWTEISKTSNGTGYFEAEGNEAAYVLSGRS